MFTTRNLVYILICVVVILVAYLLVFPKQTSIDENVKMQFEEFNKRQMIAKEYIKNHPQAQHIYDSLTTAGVINRINSESVRTLMKELNEGNTELYYYKGNSFIFKSKIPKSMALYINERDECKAAAAVVDLKNNDLRYTLVVDKVVPKMGETVSAVVNSMIDISLTSYTTSFRDEKLRVFSGQDSTKISKCYAKWYDIFIENEEKNYAYSAIRHYCFASENRDIIGYLSFYYRGNSKNDVETDFAEYDLLFKKIISNCYLEVR